MSESNEPLSLEQIQAKMENILESRRRTGLGDFEIPEELRNLFEVWATTGLKLSTEPKYNTNWASVKFGLNKYLEDMGFSHLQIKGKRGGKVLLSLFRDHFGVDSSVIWVESLKNNPHLFGVMRKESTPSGGWYHFIDPTLQYLRSRGK